MQIRSSTLAALTQVKDCCVSSETPPVVQQKCEYCSAEFGTSRGAKIHESRVHSVQCHAKRSGKSYWKCRWNDEESHMMAMKEIELKQQGVKFINIELHKHFPHRTLASIRGHACRRQIEYKTILQQCIGSSLENIQTPHRVAIPAFGLLGDN